MASSLNLSPLVLDGLEDFAGRGKVLQTSRRKDEEAALREVLETPWPDPSGHGAPASHTLHTLRD